jgi:hypothetical protein
MNKSSQCDIAKTDELKQYSFCSVNSVSSMVNPMGITTLLIEYSLPVCE